VTIKQADKLVELWHRHHKPRGAHRWSIGLEVNGELVGAAIVERPKARNTEQYRIAEVSRLVTNGIKNGCSKLYGAAARIAKEMGYDEIQTMILITEPGTSLKAAGYEFSHITEGGEWNRLTRKRRTDQPPCRKAVWKKKLR
jgi:hypothetical protein